MRIWLHDTAGGLPATFWYLWSGLLINRTGAFAMLYLSLYLTEVRGADTALAGLVVGAYGAGGVAGVLLGGVLADGWGRRATLLASHLATVALMVALAFTSSLATIAVLATLVGIAHSMPGPAFVAAIVDVVPIERRSRAFNLQFWAHNLGMAAAALLAGLLSRASFTALFLVDAAATLATALIVAWKVRETLVRHRTPQKSAQKTDRARQRRPGLRTALTDRTFLVFVGLTLVQAVMTAQTSTIMPLSMRADGLSPSAYGTVVALGGALIVVGQLFVPRLIDGYVKHRVLAVSTGLLAAGFGALAFADHLAFYLAASAIWTIGSMLAAPPNAEINAELAPPTLRARYQSVFYLVFPMAAFVAPALGGVSLKHLGDWHWVITAGMGLLAVGGHLLAGPFRERRMTKIRSVTPDTSLSAA
ncbi:MFS transporter [Micromonospora polyrhachis]|uniref:MFS family permease n=1 Tax=Micromonospora polyrhachis TaxID=1282883 RepID=A0A7W7WPY2_9ACTN|nr:MFS transporter [Micromonospora polyrhachis]MBB4959716.1 MFS family permease [Micromonospora polyrhachis]